MLKRFLIALSLVFVGILAALFSGFAMVAKSYFLGIASLIISAYILTSGFFTLVNIKKDKNIISCLFLIISPLLIGLPTMYIVFLLLHYLVM